MTIHCKAVRFSRILKAIGASLVFAVAVGSLSVDPPALWAEDSAHADESKRNEEGETTEASQEAKDKLEGFTGGIKSFFRGIKNWIGGIFTSLDDSIHGMFGGEEDTGMGAFFGTVVWAIIIIVFLFVAVFAYNIIKSMFGGGESSVSERYRKD